MEQSTPIIGAVERFYDQLRGSGPSLTSLAHGARSIGQECALTDTEIACAYRLCNPNVVPMEAAEPSN